MAALKRSLCGLALIGLTLSTAARAADCPGAPDHSAALSELMQQVQTAKDPGSAQALSHQMWQFWTDAPDEVAQEMLNRGMRRRGSYDFLGALQDFDALVSYCPNYAEGYNQRAFVHYLTRDFAAALQDLDQTLALAPQHIGAKSGRALALLGLDRIKEARSALQEALTLNPWLPERHLALPGGPLAAEGAAETKPGTDL